jgi:hypothetical protein
MFITSKIISNSLGSYNGFKLHFVDLLEMLLILSSRSVDARDPETLDMVESRLESNSLSMTRHNTIYSIHNFIKNEQPALTRVTESIEKQIDYRESHNIHTTIFGLINLMKK